MRVLFFTLILAMIPSVSSNAKSTNLKIEGWDFNLPKGAVIKSNRKFHKSNLIELDYKKKKISILIKDHLPISKSSIKRLMKDYGGKKNTLKTTIKKNQPTTFSFLSSKQTHFFSTKGSYLQITFPEKMSGKDQKESQKWIKRRTDK